MADELKLEAQLTATAEESLAALRKKVGSGRVRGPHRHEGRHELVLTRSNGKRVWLYGDSPGEVLERARAFVERATKGAA